MHHSRCQHASANNEEVQGGDTDDGSSSYYATVRLALLGSLLLLGMQLVSWLYLRWAIGTDVDDAHGLPFVMCAIAQSVAWVQMLVLMVQLSGVSLAAPTQSTVLSSLLQYSSSACLWVLTPFAYLYHEAIGIGVWLATGAAARAVEAG